MTIPSRMYTGGDDLLRMKALVADAWRIRGPRYECTPGDLDWRMYRFATFDATRDVRLWEDAGGRILGFAWVLRSGDVDFLVHPDAPAGFEADMLAWADARVLEAREAAPELTFTAFALEGNARLIAAFERHGLRATDRLYLHTALPLEGEPIGDPDPVLPPGHVVRAVDLPADLEARVAVHRAAFGSARVSTESYRRLATAPGTSYRADLDVVVVAPGGRFAAFALGWLDGANAVGEFEPVGTHPDHRRRGLARAALLDGLRRFRAAGARLAIVYSLAADVPSTALYASIGFRTVDRNRGFVAAARGVTPRAPPGS